MCEKNLSFDASCNKLQYYCEFQLDKYQFVVCKESHNCLPFLEAYKASLETVNSVL